MYGMTSQIRTSISVSVAANIAEGYGRDQTRRHLSQFLRIAQGSLKELETHLQSYRLALVSLLMRVEAIGCSGEISMPLEAT